jgi:quinol monooxygenase YgiN
MVTCTFEMLFEDSVETEALRVLKTLLFPVRAEQGCLGTRLLDDMEGEDRVVCWISRWDCHQAFERHVRTAHFHRLLGIVEMASEEPVVLVENSIKRWGFEAIEKILVTETRA